MQQLPKLKFMKDPGKHTGEITIKKVWLHAWRYY